MIDETVPTVNIPAMRRWVAALRSGEFRQGAGTLVFTPARHLNRPREYCCLGVAATIFAEECGITVGHDDSYDGGWSRFLWVEDGAEEKAADHLPMPVVDLLGIPTNLRDEDVNSRQADIILPIDFRTHNGMSDRTTMSNLNDAHGWSFARIADALEYAFPEIKVTDPDA